MELSSIAHQLDEEERMRMAEGGVTSEDYRTFLQVLTFNSPNQVLKKCGYPLEKDEAFFLWGSDLSIITMLLTS